MATPPNILLIADRDRSDVQDVLDSIEPVLRTHAGTVTECPVGDDAIESGDADLAVIVGGDGTMIQQRGRCWNSNCPSCPSTAVDLDSSHRSTPSRWPTKPRASSVAIRPVDGTCC